MGKRINIDKFYLLTRRMKEYRKTVKDPQKRHNLKVQAKLLDDLIEKGPDEVLNKFPKSGGEKDEKNSSD